MLASLLEEAALKSYLSVCSSCSPHCLWLSILFELPYSFLPRSESHFGSHPGVAPAGTFVRFHRGQPFARPCRRFLAVRQCAFLQSAGSSVPASSFEWKLRAFLGVYMAFGGPIFAPAAPFTAARRNGCAGDRFIQGRLKIHAMRPFQKHHLGGWMPRGSAALGEGGNSPSGQAIDRARPH